MTKLTKQQIADRDTICSDLRESMEKLRAAVDTYNEIRVTQWDILSAALEAYNSAMAQAWEDLEATQAEYNSEALRRANEWKNDISSQIDDYMADKSEKWQESDRGQAVSAWKETFEEDLSEASLEQPEPIEIDEPDELSLDGDDAAEVLEQIAEQAE